MQTNERIVDGRDITYDPRTDVIVLSGEPWGEEATHDLTDEYDIELVKPVVGWAPYTHLARVTNHFEDGESTYALVIVDSA